MLALQACATTPSCGDWFLYTGARFFQNKGFKLHGLRNMSLYLFGWQTLKLPHIMLAEMIVNILVCLEEVWVVLDCEQPSYLPIFFHQLV